MHMDRISKLDWPVGWPRAEYRRRSSFDMSLDRATRDLAEQIRMLGGDAPLLTHNRYNGGSDPSDPGVSVWFELNGQRKVFACDRFDRVRDNIRAIGKTIEAMRGIARWGASDMMERAFTGFDALPAPLDCWQILGLAPGATEYEIQQAWRTQARTAHPDHGGSAERMSELNTARDTALEKVRAA